MSRTEPWSAGDVPDALEVVVFHSFTLSFRSRALTADLSLYVGGGSWEKYVGGRTVREDSLTVVLEAKILNLAKFGIMNTDQGDHVTKYVTCHQGTQGLQKSILIVLGTEKVQRPDTCGQVIRWQEGDTESEITDL